MTTVTQLFSRIPFLPFLSSSPPPRSPAVERRVAAAPRAVPSVADRFLAAARRPPVLDPIEWDGDEALVPFERAPEPSRMDARAARIRERYIGARFHGMVRSAADLREASHVVKVARLLFEEGEAGAAHELLDLAIAQEGDESVALAAIELSFLARDAHRFASLARAFLAAHAGSEAWEEVIRLGRAVAPGDELFSGVLGERDHEHYGPWPHLPNWIQAPWDLTAECAAADFHRAMRAAA